MLFPCRLKTQISTASSATNMRPSAWEYPTPGWVNFQLATPGQFCIGGNTHSLDPTIRPINVAFPPRSMRPLRVLDYIGSS